MEKPVLQRLSSELRIAPECILREYWELALLDELSKEDWSAACGFKGGTALRLAYGSPRFSDDLDFSLIGSLRASKVFAWSERVTQRLNVEITDRWEKRNTILVEYRIRGEALTQSFKQKLELSKRTSKPARGTYELRLLSSPVTNVQVLFSVASLETIWDEKLIALADRREPRDLFDLWYLGQKLQRPLPADLPPIPVRILKRTLNKYLPPKFYPVVEELARR